jgi:nitroreductase
MSAGAARVPSFRREVEPILTRLGCNQGACHGKQAGQNGFRLSLRGYAPELDHHWITEELGGRRIQPAQPESSLLLTKPLGKVPHEGLVRFEEGSRYHRTLVEWVAARAPGPRSNAEEPDPVKLELLPGDKTYAVGAREPLQARVHWPDGQTEDVTWLAQFFSNDETVATVSADGTVSVLRVGETSIRGHFMGVVGVVRVTVPQETQVEPWRFGKVQNPIDTAVFAKLAALGIPASPRCDDATFLRRAMLDTIGTLPTPVEVEAFLEDRTPDKRARLVDAILGRREYADYWTLQLADLLQNRRERDHDVRGTKGVRAFHGWLHGRLAAGVGWDVLAREILTAEGDSFSNPAVGYYVTLVGEKRAPESEVTDSVAQAFLGTRIGCARCHNHPLEKYTQDDFHQFSAFFSRMHLDRKEPEKGATVLVPTSKEQVERRQKLEAAKAKVTAAEGRVAAAADAASVKKELEELRREVARREKELAELEAKVPATEQPRTRQSVEARALDRQAVHWKPGEDPRRVLADWVTSTNNPLFAESMVNRLWKHFLGVGMVEPVDDLRASNPPSNPELMAFLAREFRNSGHDLRHVMRLILNSRTYQLSSASMKGNESDRKFFSHYQARRLPAEVLADAVAVVTGVAERFDGHPVGVRAIQLAEPQTGSYFLSLFGRSERVTACACERKGEVTLPQLLHLQNGAETARKLADTDGRIRRIARPKRELSEAVGELYVVALGRRPTRAELDTVLPTLDGVAREEALRDLAWALLNSKEFNFNH